MPAKESSRSSVRRAIVYGGQGSPGEPERCQERLDRSSTRRLQVLAVSSGRFARWTLVEFRNPARRDPADEDSSVTRSPAGGAARGEGSQKGRDHYPRHGQGEASRGQGDRRRQRQGYRRGEEDPARREGRGQDPVREVL